MSQTEPKSKRRKPAQAVTFLLLLLVVAVLAYVLWPPSTPAADVTPAVTGVTPTGATVEAIPTATATGVVAALITSPLGAPPDEIGAEPATLAPGAPNESPLALPAADGAADTPVATPGQPPIYTYEVINVYPHDPGAFTQGLVFDGETLYEGTGLNGRSSLRRVDLASGQVLQQVDLAAEYFGEGITVWDDHIIQLTWQSRRGFVYNKTTFARIADFTYPTEGWGITHDGRRLIMSDGSATLYFWNPDTFTPVDSVDVYDISGPVVRLNELEYINGEVWANIWQTDYIARIDPVTGQVLGWVDLSGLLTPAERASTDVLNGIAYMPESDRLFVTGKLWPKLFEIRVIPVP